MYMPIWPLYPVPTYVQLEALYILMILIVWSDYRGVEFKF